MSVGTAKAKVARETVAGKAKASAPASSRNATEIASMTERLDAVVRAQPGETMTILTNARSSRSAWLFVGSTPS
jgi:hypothetical protein